MAFFSSFVQIICIILLQEQSAPIDLEFYSSISNKNNILKVKVNHINLISLFMKT